MDAYRGDDELSASRARKRREAGFWVLGLVALLIVGFTLEDDFGIPFDTSYRVACAAECLFFIYKLGLDYPGQQWPRISLWIALLINVGIFFTPLVDRPTSRGEVMLFALPDAVVVLAASIVSYRVNDVHQRATRQTMILGLIVALVFCVGLFAITLAEVHTAHVASRRNGWKADTSEAELALLSFGSRSSAAFGFEPLNIDLALVGHLSEDRDCLGIADLLGEIAALGNASPHTIDRIIAHDVPFTFDRVGQQANDSRSQVIRHSCG